MRIWQFTDLHLTSGATVRGVDTHATAASCLAHARRTQPAPAAMVLTGDLVNDDGDAYQRLRQLFAGETPVHVLPGNHDLPALMYIDAEPPLNARLSTSLGAWQLVKLDTHVPGEVGGGLGSAKLANLDEALTNAGGKPTLVALHHPPVLLGSAWLDDEGLSDQDALWTVIDRHPHVRALIWGHAHQAHDLRRGDVAVLGTPSTCFQSKPACDDFLIDDRPPGYRWLELHDDGRFDTAVTWVEPGA